MPLLINAALSVNKIRKTNCGFDARSMRTDCENSALGGYYDGTRACTRCIRYGYNNYCI